MWPRLERRGSDNALLDCPGLTSFKAGVPWLLVCWLWSTVCSSPLATCGGRTGRLKASAVKSSSVRCVDLSRIWLAWKLWIDPLASVKSYRRPPIRLATDPAIQSWKWRHRTETASPPSKFRSTAPCRRLKWPSIFESRPVGCLVVSRRSIVTRGLRPRKSSSGQCCCGRVELGVVL